MRIQSMFKDDINRKINGVVKVDQDESSVLVQELNEYVITRELKKHFITFFNNYIESFNETTADIGVWISGFFGSGKSHFLKMLSYLLENKEVQGVKTVERFRAKFADDPATFMLIDRATKGRTDTILFNIDIEGSINKDKTAVLRVFAKMFYNYLGFYGENLKVAKLEQFIAKKGKTEEFRRVFEEKNGASWLESRDAYAFFEDDIVATLQEVLGMSEQAASNWFNGTETVETSIAQLVSEIKEYVDTQPRDFRLLFMIDEVGQYVGGDTDLLINLQSLVEKIGSECGGKVWVVCTGQEAIDEIIKARENEFSRIQARFKTRLSLSSSSADEVIQKRILLKTDEAEHDLEQLYAANDSVLRNLFSFTDAILDIKGYTGAGEFAKNFPFVPYQFILMQKVFAEIRKHGNSGKHLSGGERSMLSGFQEAAQKIEDKDEYALAPFYLFYDTVHTFLDSSIRRVIERCQRAADDGNGIEPQDVNVLKLLYLVRYVDDVKANLDNIVILMADDIRLDKITMREQVRGSLDRLLSHTKIDTSVTDEEVDTEIETQRNANARTVTITDRAVKEGDTAVIDFEGFVDGVAFEGGKGENHPLEIGSHSFIDTFEDQLVGKNTGDEVEVNVTFPEQYQAQELAGKPATFKVKINEIRAKELPELNDEFVQDVSEFDTMAEYREDVKKKLQERKENAAKGTKEDEAIQKIIDKSKMEIPDAMIDMQAENMIEEFAQRISAQGMSFEQYLQFSGMTVDKLKEQVRPEAVQRIQSSLVLEQIAKEENIVASDEDVDAEVEKMAAMYGMKAEDLKSYMGDSEKESMKRDIAVKKAVEFVMANVKERAKAKSKTAEADAE